MSFGSRILQARKEKNMSQESLAKALNTTPTTIGRYERDEVKPSIEVAAKIADVLDVSLDYLIGRSDNYIRDKKVLNRINDILSLNNPDRDMILNTLDALLRDAKTRKAYS